MEKYENDIHNCTSDRLAHMLEALAASCISLCGMRNSVYSDAEVMCEAARRLRERRRPAFNNEAIE